MKKSPLAILFLTVLLDLIGFGIVLPLLPTYAKELGASPFMIGLIAAIYSTMQFIFSPIWGKLSDKIGRRPVMLSSIFLASISYVFFSQAVTIPLLILARSLSGIGSANIAAAQAAITDVTDSKSRSGAMGMLGAAFGIGFIIGPLVGGVLMTNFGISMVGLFAAGLNFINFTLAFFLLNETNPHAEGFLSLFRKNPKSVGHANNSLLASLSRKSSAYMEKISAAFSSRPVVLLMIINFIYTLAIVNMQVSAILLWSDVYHATEQQVGYLFAYVGFFTVIVQGVMLPKMTRKYGEHKLMVLGHITSFIGVFFIPFIPVTSLFTVGLAILLFFAIGTSLVNPLNISMISLYSYKQKQGQIMGFAQSVNALARILGPFSGSILYGYDHRMPYYVAGALTVVGTFISMTLFKYEIEAFEPTTEIAE
ncbi:MFS transporter [Chlorobaculum sp. MV4-Y]|uniref:MFS transporter n=1 Tax=Chlorobaculum sp. MV4-Y TaxID=2976335 RepID=UPI0021B048DE|nr:MFS transporter [Chlorobaculum sp. MV4-Y]UWX58460.1 MFS transporter [Chlorobaculum sp. MV4-Y]